jgi:ubiquinone/menaquinone biosynthesis C-methylase UbiE
VALRDDIEIIATAETPLTTMILSTLKILLVLIAAGYLFRQVRKPDRFLGQLFARLMNKSHSRLTDWGLSHVRIASNFQILDAGCGGGRTIEKLAAIAPSGKIFGIDYAPGSVATSRSRNRELIRDGRVVIHQTSVSQLPFEANAFDLVTAIETQYYWPDLVNDMREILRVLKPSGTLAVISETYKGGSRDAVLGPVMKLLGSSMLGVAEHRQLFTQAGYTGVEVFEESNKGWICVTGKKPGI